MNLLNSLQELVKKSPGRTAREYGQKLKAQGLQMLTAVRLIVYFIETQHCLTRVKML